MSAKKNKLGKIDDISLKQLEKQVEKGISNKKQLNRSELNFYCELYSQLTALSESVREFNRLFTLIHANDLRDEFKKFEEKNIES